MTPAATLDEADRVPVAELAPVLRRALGLDRRAVVRLRFATSVATVLVRLPFGVLVSRSVAVAGSAAGGSASVAGAGGVARVAAGAAAGGVAGVAGAGGDGDGDGAGPGTAPGTGLRDLTVGARELLDWLDGSGTVPPPSARDAEWRGGLPPSAGWRRLDTLPDDAIRPLVRQGALTLKDAAAREGVPGAQPRQEVADALLDAVVVEVSDADGEAAQLTLRSISALTRMGFLPRGGGAHVDVAGRWIRVVGGYGTVYLERPGTGLAGLAVLG